MDADTIARIFDPYFATKPDGRGTGLRLSTVYGTIEQAGGGIEADLRRTVHDVLSTSYDVVSADSGPTALDLLQKQRFDIVLTDPVMPRMSGRELATRIAERWPDIRVVFMSGYDKEHVASGGVVDLHKPFTLEQLMDTIERFATGSR